MNNRSKVAASLIALLVWSTGVCAPSAPMEEGRQNESNSGALLPKHDDVTILPSVVVTATANERAPDNVPASIAVVGGDDLRRRPVNDLADALRGAEGISLEDVGQGRRGISIRGMSSEHTLMLVDGQRISASASAIAHSDFELGWVPAEAIDRLEVVRGPMSSLYGSEALGGVVNVITRAPTDHWTGSLSSYALATDHGLGGNQYKNGFYIAGPLIPGQLGLSAWGEVRRRHMLHDASSPALSALDRQRAVTGHLGLSWTPDARQRIDLTIDAVNEDQTGLHAGTRNIPYQSDNEIQRRRYAFTHTGQWSWGNSRVRLYRSTLDRQIWRSDGDQASGPNRFVDTVFDTQASFSPVSAHRLTVGGQLRRESLQDPNVNRQGKKAQAHQAFFVQDEMTLGSHWELVLGSRFDRHDSFGWEISPRAYVLFHPLDGLVLKAGVGRGFKAPTLKQLSPEFESWAAMGGRGVIRGNPDLQPETNLSYELGATYEADSWSAAATFFHNNVRNLIDTVRQPTCFAPGRVCLAYENVARVRLQGVELTGGADLSASWRLDANYTYLDARDRITGEPMPDRSRHRANATLAWKPLASLSTRVQLEYIGAQVRQDQEGKRPGYAMLHWYLDYDLNRNLSVQLGVENLTDKRLANDDIGLFSRADEGRRYFVGMRVQF
ncbi:TonB-dependent receptor domain-containing protein [Advenella sp. S44]|uniref:TonB-dependent receptor domain-containing protein n=1 Tax=Advenella sp. S44 TaxID=1982755 RepID=UPI001F5B74D3|nr:TonB-dependent receptor [Advenella sp. S44]